MTTEQQITFIEQIQASSQEHLQTASTASKLSNSDVYVSNMTTVFILNAIGGALAKALSSR